MTDSLEAALPRLRAETPACAEVIHFNHAGDSPSPRPVLDVVQAHLEREALIGGYEAEDEALERIEGVYASIGRLINAATDEIAIVENATRAWDMAFYAIPFSPGDRILTSVSEYGSQHDRLPPGGRADRGGGRGRSQRRARPARRSLRWRTCSTSGSRSSPSRTCRRTAVSSSRPAEIGRLVEGGRCALPARCLPDRRVSCRSTLTRSAATCCRDEPQVPARTARRRLPLRPAVARRAAGPAVPGHPRRDTGSRATVTRSAPMRDASRTGRARGRQARAGRSHRLRPRPRPRRHLGAGRAAGRHAA